MKQRKMIHKIVLGVLMFLTGMFWGLLTLERFAPPSEVEIIAGHFICSESGSSMCSILNTDKKMDIPPTVLEYKTDGNYITVRQHPDIPQNTFFKHVNYPDYNSESIYYWIIDLHCDSIVDGPMDYQSFKDKCMLLCIVDSLSLFAD